MQEMNKYSNGKIYKVVSPNHPKVYYGSTIQTLKNRFDGHRRDEHSGCTSKEIIDVGGADILEIEAFPCTCKEELEDREAEYILNDWEGCVNDRVPGAVRRAGGEEAYQKAYAATPERKASLRAYAQTPEVKAYQKAYAQRPEAKAKKAEKIKCNVCACMITRGNMSRHQKRKKCQNHLKTEVYPV